MRSYLIALIALTLFASCSSLKDQAKSRELLAKCEYSLEDIGIENIKFSEVIQIVETAKEVNWKEPNPDIRPLLNDIRKMNFELDFKQLDIQANIGIYNPNEHEVVLDSIYFDAYFDDVKVGRVNHSASVSIPKASQNVVETNLRLAKGIKLRKIQQAEEIHLRGKVWLKIELAKGFPVTLPVKFDVSKPVPRDQINGIIDEQKKKVVAKIVKEILKGGFKNLLDKL